MNKMVDNNDTNYDRTVLFMQETYILKYIRGIKYDIIDLSNNIKKRNVFTIKKVL